MTNLECTKCGDMVAVTANAVLLPFVCMRCDQTGLERTSFGSLAGGYSPDQEADVAAVAQFYEDMKPASEKTPQLGRGSQSALCACGKGIDDNGDGDCPACAVPTKLPTHYQLTPKTEEEE